MAQCPGSLSDFPQVIHIVAGQGLETTSSNLESSFYQ